MKRKENQFDHLFQNLSRQFHTDKENTSFPEKEFFENAK